jgi:hypothetical protein
MKDIGVAGTGTGHKRNKYDVKLQTAFVKRLYRPSIGLVALVQLLQPSGPPSLPPSDPLVVKYALELQSQFLGNKVPLYDNAD